MKQNKNILLLLAIIFTYISMALSIIAMIVITFNMFGVVDALEQYIHQNVSNDIDVARQMTLTSFEMLFSVLMNLYFLRIYTRYYKHGVFGPEYGRSLIFAGILQLLFSVLLPAILAIIAGIKMSRQKVLVVETDAPEETQISDYKMTAMKEAIARLKELRAKGAISEEEYYANLNRILEG